MGDNTIKKRWESYRYLVLPENASEVQISECRNAFYAGAWALFVEIAKASLDTDPDFSRAKIRDLNAELKAYMRLT